MKVLLIGKNNIYKVELPKSVNNNYWLSDKTAKEEKRLINIRAIDGKWKVISSNYAKIINPKSIKLRNNDVVVDRKRRKYIRKCLFRRK